MLDCIFSKQVTITAFSLNYKVSLFVFLGIICGLEC